jgi:hypothetical protein
MWVLYGETKWPSSVHASVRPNAQEGCRCRSDESDRVRAEGRVTRRGELCQRELVACSSLAAGDLGVNALKW